MMTIPGAKHHMQSCNIVITAVHLIRSVNLTTKPQTSTANTDGPANESVRQTRSSVMLQDKALLSHSGYAHFLPIVSRSMTASDRYGTNRVAKFVGAYALCISSLDRAAEYLQMPDYIQLSGKVPTEGSPCKT